VVVFAAAVFVLQAAVAQSAQLAALPAWQLAPERGVPQAAQPVAQADPQVAQSAPCELQAVHSVPCEWPAVRSVALPADPQAVHLALDELQAVHSVPCEWPAVRSVALPADPQAVHLALDESSAVRSVALLGDPQADCWAVRLGDDHWSQAAVS